MGLNQFIAQIMFLLCAFTMGFLYRESMYKEAMERRARGEPEPTNTSEARFASNLRRIGASVLNQAAKTPILKEAIESEAFKLGGSAIINGALDPEVVANAHNRLQSVESIDNEISDGKAEKIKYKPLTKEEQQKMLDEVAPEAKARPEDQKPVSAEERKKFLEQLHKM